MGERIIKSNNLDELLGLSMEQADTLDQLIAMSSKADEKESWIRQLAECLTAAATQSPKEDLRALNRMAYLAGASVDHAAPWHALAAYVGFHQLEIDHCPTGRNHQCRPRHRATVVASSAGQLCQCLPACQRNIQGSGRSWRPSAKPPARTKMPCRCYRFMLEYQPEGCDLHKAEGALNRLNLTGQEFHLTLPILKADMTSDEPFDVETLKGHVVIVYFWSVTNEHWLADMRQVAGVAADRRRQLVCVNCDANPGDAVKALGNHQLGIQLYQRKGLEGRVQQRMGLFEVPYVILVSKYGRVINKGVEPANSANGRRPSR